MTARSDAHALHGATGSEAVGFGRRLAPECMQMVRRSAPTLGRQPYVELAVATRLRALAGGDPEPLRRRTVAERV